MYVSIKKNNEQTNEMRILMTYQGVSRNKRNNIAKGGDCFVYISTSRRVYENLFASAMPPVVNHWEILTKAPTTRRLEVRKR